MVALVVVLALLAGVASAAEPVAAFEDDTNTTASLSDTTNDTVDTVERTANETGSAVGSTTGDAADTVAEPTDTRRTEAGGSDLALAERERLVELLGRAEVEALGPAANPLGGSAESVASDTSRATDPAPQQMLDDGQATAAADDLAESASVGATAEDGGVTATGADRPGLAGVAVGLQVVVAGVALRELADLPAPAGTAAVTARRTLDRLPRLFAPLRYSRYDDSDPLEHEDRAAVLEAIEDSPGVYLTELSEQLDVALSTLRHHVRVLKDEDLLAAARVRGRRRFYPAHTEEVELAAAMNDEATAPIVDALARLGAVTVSDLADADGRDASTVTHHLQRLEADGLVVREREGRAIVNRLAPEAREALAPLVDADGEPGEADVEATVSAD